MRLRRTARGCFALGARARARARPQVHYIKRTLPHEQIVALYAAADVGLVTSVREGINTCAMEFVACQGNDSTGAEEGAREGVLVYSEFAGCAASFKGALVVNP